jgi:ectoine hydroxylase
MKLTQEEVDFFSTNGYLEWDHLFDEHELESIIEEVPNTIRQNDDRIIYEDNGAVRTIFAPDSVNELFDRLARLDRIVEPVKQLLGSDVYLHQFKINSKKAFTGDWWEWHQDYPYWHLEDFIPKPKMLSVMIFLQDTDHHSGPLMVIPGTHRDGVAEFQPKEHYNQEGNFTYQGKEDLLSSLSADLKFTVKKELLKSSIQANGIKSMTGKKGKVLVFHGNLYHGSGVNMNYEDRNMVILTYNSVLNTPEKKSPRPEYLANQDFRPIETVFGLHMQSAEV